MISLYVCCLWSGGQYPIQPSDAVRLPRRTRRRGALWHQRLQHAGGRRVLTQGLLLGLCPPPGPAGRRAHDTSQQRQRAGTRICAAQEAAVPCLPTDRTLLL